MTSAKKVLRRSSTKHSVFGFPVQLPKLQISSKEDVFKHNLWHRNAASAKGGKTIWTRDIIKLVAYDVISIWNKARIPVKIYCSIVARSEKIIEKV